MRSVVDQKRHYKKGYSNSKTLPKYFQASSWLQKRCNSVTTIRIYILYRVYSIVSLYIDFTLLSGKVIGIFTIHQVGTVIESASDFFSGRLTKKERKATLADELLSDHTLGEYR